MPSPRAVRRPRGVHYDTAEQAVYGPSQALDYELEMGMFISRRVEHKEELDIRDVEEHIFGFVLLNDWSARDLQGFEMKPLGPFHGKGSSSANQTSWLSVLTCVCRLLYINQYVGGHSRGIGALSLSHQDISRSAAPATPKVATRRERDI